MSLICSKPAKAPPLNAEQKQKIFFFNLLAALCGMWHLSSPEKGPNPCPLPWKLWVLTTGQPGKSSNKRPYKGPRRRRWHPTPVLLHHSSIHLYFTDPCINTMIIEAWQEFTEEILHLILTTARQEESQHCLHQRVAEISYPSHCC